MGDKVAEAREYARIVEEKYFSGQRVNHVPDHVEMARMHVNALLAEIDRLRPLLDDAMGLLHNHEQHEDRDWLDDYDDVCKRYDAHLSGNTGQLDEYDRGYNDVEAAIEAARAEERERAVELCLGRATRYETNELYPSYCLNGMAREARDIADAIKSMEENHASKSS